MTKNRLFHLVFGLIVVVVVISAALPLFGQSYIPTHDGEYHIIRIVEFAKMLSSGYWFPKWAPTLNSGYGIPIFEYHYPLPNYIGSFLSAFTHDAVRAFFLSMGIGYLIAVIASFGWLVCLFGVLPAAVGVLISAYVPYWFVDLYVRGSVGEVWAIAFLFITLYVSEKKHYVLVALSYGLLIVSHNILAMVFTPFLLVYMLLRHKKALASLVAGIGMSAYFWLPAFIEKSYVVGLNTVNFREHFVALYQLLIPSWGTEFSGIGITGNTISFQLGIVPLFLFCLVGIVIWKERQKELKYVGLYLLSVIMLAIVFMFSCTKILWETIQPLQLIQYPWRLLSFVIPVAGFLGAYITATMKKPIVGIILAALAVVFAYSYTRPVLYESRNEAYYVSRVNFTDGTSSMGNSFSTIWTGWKEQRSDSELVIQNGRITDKQTWKYLDRNFKVVMTDDGTIVVHTLYFPGWTVYIDKKETPIFFEKDGVIHITVAKGTHDIQVIFKDTPVRLFGNIISMVSLAVVFAWGILPYISQKSIKSIKSVKSKKDIVKK